MSTNPITPELGQIWKMPDGLFRKVTMALDYTSYWYVWLHECRKDSRNRFYQIHGHVLSGNWENISEGAKLVRRQRLKNAECLKGARK